VNPPEHLELKKFLAEQLPEKIQIKYKAAHSAKSPFDNEEIHLPERTLFYWIVFPDDSISGIIRETEWPYIVGLVEDKLNDVQWEKYTTEIAILSENNLLPLIRFCIQIPWPTRATVLKTMMKRKG
jgi:hypothetical protein